MAAKDETPLVSWDVNSPVRSVAISRDGTQVASGSADGYIRFWDVRLGALVLGPLKGHSKEIKSVAWSYDNACLASGSNDNTIRIWDTRTGALLGVLLGGHTAAVHSVAFFACGTLIVSGSSDKTIRIWDAGTRTPIGAPLKGHTKTVSSVVVSSDSTRIVSGSYDRTIRLWDVSTGSLIGKPLSGHTGDVNAVAVSSDNTRIISGSDDSTICVWDADTGTLIGKPLKGHTARVWSVAFSPNNDYIVSGSTDFTMRVWDTHTGASVGEPLKGHTGVVCSVAFLPDSVRIVSGSSDKTIRVSKVLQSIPSFDAVTGNMSVQQLFEYLVKHECTDLSASIDPTEQPSAATTSGRTSDVRQVRMKNGGLVAIKCLQPQMILEADKQRMMSELRKWSKAEHENIKGLLGIVIFQGQIGIVSNWMDNGTLGRYIQNNPIVDRYSFCVQVAKGVAYLHGIGMIHGDIRQSNVLVSADGVAKLNDFDYSILYEGTLEFSKTNQLSLGTLRWMAPELLHIQEEDGLPIMRNKFTDVYALGMTMLEIFTGRVPYDEYNYEMAIYGALYRKELPRRPKELPEENRNARRMWELLIKCWDHDPSGRPDAGDIAPAMKIFIL